MFILLYIFILLKLTVASEETLVSVVTIYRHGDRTPIKVYPNDPYRNSSYWPVDFGELTNIGKMQHYKLGQWFRNRYRNFLPERYSEQEVYIRSTDLDRTLMSAEANLAGLFPPKNKQIWKKGMKWQPIPIHTTPEKLDNILLMKYPCDRYDYLLKKLKSSPEFLKINETNRELYQYLSEHSGDTINSIETLLFLYDTLLIERSYNYTLPIWTKSVFPDKLEPWAAFAFAVECYTPNLARLRAGPLLSEIVNNFLLSTNDKGYKFVAYSAHDITIANVLNSLNLFRYHCPSYTAAVLFELHYLNYGYYINMLYKNATSLEKLTLRNCSYDCPLDNFIELLKPLLITPDEWLDECQLRYFDFPLYFIKESIIFIIGLAFLIAMAIVIAFCIAFKLKKPKEHHYVRLDDTENVYD